MQAAAQTISAVFRSSQVKSSQVSLISVAAEVCSSELPIPCSFLSLRFTRNNIEDLAGTALLLDCRHGHATHVRRTSKRSTFADKLGVVCAVVLLPSFFSATAENADG